MAKRPSKNDVVTCELVANENEAIRQSNRATKTNTTSRVSRAKFPIVGIVASAGGLESFKSFLAAMPSDCGMAFVLVPHLDATHKSSMVELLARQTSMPVIEVLHDMQVELNSVYVIPPNHCLTLSKGRLQLSDLPNPIGSQTAIDPFLRSLAEDQQERAIGIIFSGTGTHGTLGIREIKRLGGMAMVQSPESAEFDQMPQSAIETGLVDFVLAPGSMPEVLLRYAKHPYVNQSCLPASTLIDSAEQLANVVELIRAQTPYDFRSYRPNMILRRIERRMGIVQLDDFAKYIEMLQSHPQEVEALSKDFLIGVTSFFREVEAFAFLEKSILPALVANHGPDSSVRFWVPACATGEEAYSLAILLLEAFENAGKTPRIQIFASDINQQSIDVARRGIYPASIANDISEERLKKFFVPSGENHYRVNKRLRDAIVFSNQNVISDAPFSRIDLISCRNLMIYLEPELQQKLISLFHYSLVDSGVLLLGSAETIGRSANLFTPISKTWRIYRRDGPVASSHSNTSLPIVDIQPRMKPSETRTTQRRNDYKGLVENTLREYVPAAVLINRRYEVLYVAGSLVDYLEFPSGELSKDLLAMARAGLRTRLRAVCHKAFSQQVVAIDPSARVQRNGSYVACSITVHPIIDAKVIDGLALVVFQDQSSGKSANHPNVLLPEYTDPSVEDSGGSALVQLLEYELKSTREELQNAIEEMESANEELQSSNEELESSKEELQSLNEELSTANCQLLEKVAELDKSNGEIANLMASTEIATVYLDSQLRIKRFTSSAITLFNLVPSDEGRDIRDFDSQLVDSELLEKCQQVLLHSKPVDTEICTQDNRCFLRRILPYRLLDKAVDGVVVTFIDLTERNRAEAEQRERDACFREIFDHAATGIAILNLDGIFVKCNPAYCKLTGYSEDELRSIHFLSLVHPDDRSRNNDVLRTLLAFEVPSFEIENRYLHHDGSTVFVRKFVSLLPDVTGNAALLLALVTDVSTQRRTLDALSQSEERIRTILRTASDAIITFDNCGLIDSANQATESMFGYTDVELVGQNLSMLMPQSFSRELEGSIQLYLKSGNSQILATGREILCLRKDGTTFPADLAVSQVDHLGLFTGILRDVSSRKEMERHVLEIAADEQRRIGGELHDGTQQELTGLSLYANALLLNLQSAVQVQSEMDTVWQLSKADFERIQLTATLLTKRLVETNEHVRDLAHGIMPVQIDAEGLRSALTVLANSLNANKDIHCQFDCEGDISIPNTTTATHLYRIAQEAVNNALRHGSADRIRIFLLLKDDRIVLEISDNGVGFHEQSLGKTPKGMGMRTMEYRARLIGGQIQILQGPEGGTLVRCDVLKEGNLR